MLVLPAFLFDSRLPNDIGTSVVLGMDPSFLLLSRVNPSKAARCFFFMKSFWFLEEQVGRGFLIPIVSGLSVGLLLSPLACIFYELIIALLPLLCLASIGSASPFLLGADMLILFDLKLVC